MARLFVAVRPPAEVRTTLEALDRPEDPRIRWVPPLQWHVTVRFWPDGDPDVVWARLDRAAGSGELAMAQARLGPGVERLGPSAIVLPVAGLDDLAAAVSMATTDDGASDGNSDGASGDGSGRHSSRASSDEQVLLGRSGAGPRFRGHLTLGRFRGRPRRHADAPLIGTAVEAEFDVAEIELVESEVGPAGATHRVIGTWPLTS